MNKNKLTLISTVKIINNTRILPIEEMNKSLITKHVLKILERIAIFV